MRKHQCINVEQVFMRIIIYILEIILLTSGQMSGYSLLHSGSLQLIDRLV